MMRLVAAIPLVLLLVAASALTRWSIEAADSRISFSGTQIGVAFVGVFENYRTDITFDPARPAIAKVRIVIDMKSARTGNEDRDTALISPEWFATGTYPDGIFESTGFTPLGENIYRVDARLTLRGISREIVVPFQVDVAGDKAHVTGQLTLDRRDYGIGQGEQWETDKWVAYPVEIMIDVTAVRIH